MERLKVKIIVSDTRELTEQKVNDFLRKIEPDDVGDIRAKFVENYEKWICTIVYRVAIGLDGEEQG